MYLRHHCPHAPYLSRRPAPAADLITDSQVPSPQTDQRTSLQIVGQGSLTACGHSMLAGPRASPMRCHAWLSHNRPTSRNHAQDQLPTCMDRSPHQATPLQVAPYAQLLCMKVCLPSWPLFSTMQSSRRRVFQQGSPLAV